MLMSSVIIPMALDNDTTNTFAMSWRKLPQELREAVLAQLVETAQAHKESLSKYTSVSREWQVFLEGHTFRPWISG